MVLQNLVDSLAQHFQEAVPKERHGELNTFVVYNQRSRVTSSAKRKRPPGSLKIHQTPDGSFLDLQRNARDMLLRCGCDVPQVPLIPLTPLASSALSLIFGPPQPLSLHFSRPLPYNCTAWSPWDAESPRCAVKGGSGRASRAEAGPNKLLSVDSAACN